MIVRCVYCATRQPGCTGFVGIPVDGPRGQAVYECGTELPDPEVEPKAVGS
jgi:hypothetical protein